MKENIAYGNELAERFCKENGVIVYYKILSFESVLLCVGIKKE